MYGQRPAPVRLLERRGGDRFTIEDLGQYVADPAGGGLVGREPRDGGGGGEGRRLRHHSGLSVHPRFSLLAMHHHRWAIHRTINALSSVYRRICPQTLKVGLSVLTHRANRRCANRFVTLGLRRPSAILGSGNGTS